MRGGLINALETVLKSKVGFSSWCFVEYLEIIRKLFIEKKSVILIHGAEYDTGSCSLCDGVA